MVAPTFLPALVTILGAAAVPAFAVVRVWARRLGRRRNIDATCAKCGRPWAPGLGGVPDAVLVEGQLLCLDCGGSLRRRTIGAGIAFLALAGAMFLFGWGPLLDIFGRSGFIDGIAGMTVWGWTLFLPPLVLLGGADWTLRRMKRENVIALEALAKARLRAEEPAVAVLPDA